ncbi:unnamed protein product [Blepharisma stoltei]|uniref:EGF-like domain-containing protein n=1 Tax=Blepharisma stoltei TaxID=1481888 RepID=A0AAU9JSB4_9CILI|nr:unnamed protein product [Blepharisma stoltei]
MIICTAYFLLSLIYLVHAADYTIFPQAYSQFFNGSSSELDITLSEAFFSGEECTGQFGISLWVKIVDSTISGDIFNIERPVSTFTYYNNFPELYYSSSTLKIIWNNPDYSVISQTLSRSITISTNWIFVGISASYPDKTVVFCINQGSGSTCSSGSWNAQIGISFDSVLIMGGSDSFTGRVGDFKIHNNEYLQLADWNTQYTLRSSCGSTGCGESNICYSQANQWCGSYLALVQPSLWTSSPYFTVSSTQTSKIITSTDEVYFGKTLSSALSASTSLSVTGWIKPSSTCGSGTTILKIMANSGTPYASSSNILSINMASTCTQMEATIYDSSAASQQTIPGFAPGGVTTLKSVWTFFAVTSDGTNFVLYIGTSSIPASSSMSAGPTATLVPNDIWIFVGGSDTTSFKGDYADLRLYPGTALAVADINGIYGSSSAFMDPVCTSFSSIWTCQTCPSGYYIVGAMCQKCHPSCATCTANDEISCSSCSAGNYKQYGHALLCFDYCPIGFTEDTSTNSCTGTPGVSLNLNFEDNLTGDFSQSDVLIQYGLSAGTYYPDYDFQDPAPANKRGIYLERGGLQVIPKSSSQTGRVMGTDFTIELWAMPMLSGTFFSSFTSSKTCVYYYFKESCSWKTSNPIVFEIDDYGRMVVHLVNQDGTGQDLYTPSVVSSFSPYEWALYAVSLTFDDSITTTSVNIMRNTFSYTYSSISGYFKETSNMLHWIGAYSGAASYVGYIYSFVLYNYGRAPSVVQGGLGSCTCTACSASLGYCLPTCTKKQYVDDNNLCQSCDSSCSHPCNKADTCNLCYDDLCYECSHYGLGYCTECVTHATLSSGSCHCSSGYVKQNSTCVDSCDDGYYVDLAAGACTQCPSHCKKCDASTCFVCFSDFIISDGICTCADGWFSTENDTCEACDTSCKTCSVVSSNCTSCISSAPVLYDGNQCYPCSSFQGYGYTYAVSISSMSTSLLTQLAQKCTEICGDGKHMGQAQCDDGNNRSGDGCSSVCIVETGWSCSGGTYTTNDVCIDTTPPEPSLAYMSETSSGYLLGLTFSEQISVLIEMGKNIEIDVGGARKFDWSINLNNLVYIITLKMYENVATGTTVTLKFVNPSGIVDLSGNQMQKSTAKTSLPTSFTYSMGEATTTTVTTVAGVAGAGAITAAGFASCAGGMFNLQALWGMVEMMQLINYLIFLSPKYPENVKTFLSALGIANGNFLPNPFQIYAVKDDPFPDPPKAFYDENFNTDFFMNAGQFILLWMVILSGMPLVFLGYRYFPKFRLIRWLKNSYAFSVLLRTGIESFLESTLAVFLQWRHLVRPNQDIGYVSMTLSFLTFIYLMFTFGLVIFKVTRKTENVLKKENHERKYGTLYDSFKRNSRITSSFLMFQNVRRVVFVLLCVFLYEYTTVQVALSTLVSFGYTLSLILLRPFEKSVLGNAINIGSELLYFAAHCIILKFLDDQLTDSERDDLGWGVIALLASSLTLHLIACLVTQILDIINGMKKCKTWFMKNFANKFARFYKGKAMIDTIVLDNKVELKKKTQKVGKTLGNNNENLAYFEGKKTGIVDDDLNLNDTKIRPAEEDSPFEETMGDESFKKTSKSERTEEIYSLRRKKVLSP